jgi:hypothetical protein
MTCHHIMSYLMTSAISHVPTAVRLLLTTRCHCDTTVTHMYTYTCTCTYTYTYLYMYIYLFCPACVCPCQEPQQVAVHPRARNNETRAMPIPLCVLLFTPRCCDALHTLHRWLHAMSCLAWRWMRRVLSLQRSHTRPSHLPPAVWSHCVYGQLQVLTGVRQSPTPLSP